MKHVEDILFKLIAAGLGTCDRASLPKDVDWRSVFKLANQQGVGAVCLDGMQKLNWNIAEPKTIKIQWIGTTLKQKQQYNAQWQAAVSLAKIWHDIGLQIYVMKGFVLAEMYPRPASRYSCDMDCFLMKRHEWNGEKGDEVVEDKGIEIDRSYYKNSKFCFKGLTVENHRYLLPIKGSSKAKRLERWLRTQIETAEPVYIGNTFLQTPSALFNSVYILAHVQEHFFEEGISLKHVCDWAMVLNTYANKLDWEQWKHICKDYGMLSFGCAMSRLANKICGVKIPFECEWDDEADCRLLDDVLYRTTSGSVQRSNWQVRIDLVKSIFKNRWKYRMFSNTNFLIFCGRRVWGYLFDKNLD